MDVFTRKILIHMLPYSIEKGDILDMLSQLFVKYHPEGIILRIAVNIYNTSIVRKYLKGRAFARSSPTCGPDCS
jgi:hypothetical protein